MKKNNLITLLFIVLFVSCSESNDLNTIKSSEKKQVTVNYHYKNRVYPIDFSFDKDGEMVPVNPEPPQELLKVKDQENLSMVYEESNIYLFDNIKERNIFFNKKSGVSKRGGLDSWTQMKYFNDVVSCYEHRNFGGEKMPLLTHPDQLLDFRLIKSEKNGNWSDEITSVIVDHSKLFAMNIVYSPTFYMHQNLKGRSFSFRRSGAVPREIAVRDFKNVKFGCFLFWCKDNFSDEFSSVEMH